MFTWFQQPRQIAISRVLILIIVLSCLTLSWFRGRKYDNLHPPHATSSLLHSLKFPNGTKTCGIVIPSCKCTKSVCILLKENSTNYCEKTNMCSSCSGEATVAGAGQKVISYSHFGNHAKHRDTHFPYSDGIQHNLIKMREFYPGWVMRVYSNLTLKEGSEECKLICKNNDLFWCHIPTIHSLGDMSRLGGMYWRFLPIGDPLVDVFISRDLDSSLGLKERIAVRYWENSNKTFHIMRDHNRGHRIPVLGGMWGAKTKDLWKEEALALQNQFIQRGRHVYKYGRDQKDLAEVIYQPKYFSKSLAHDSFFCHKFNKTECHLFSGNKTLASPYVGKRLTLKG